LSLANSNKLAGQREIAGRGEARQRHGVGEPTTNCNSQFGKLSKTILMRIWQEYGVHQNYLAAPWRSRDCEPARDGAAGVSSMRAAGRRTRARSATIALAVDPLGSYDFWGIFLGAVNVGTSLLVVVLRTL
jgi:hypothetical protein